MALYCLYSGRELLLRQRAGDADNADEKRGYSCLRHPARIRANLFRIGGVQVEAAASMCMHIDKPWRDDHAAGINDLPTISGRRPFFRDSYGLDSGTIDGNISIGRVTTGVHQACTA